MVIKKHYLSTAAMLYLYSGIVVFLLGWVKWWLSLPAVVLIGWGLWLYFKEKGEKNDQDYEPVFAIDKNLRITKAGLLLLILAVLTICMISGYGGFFRQSADWEKHNYVLNDLVSKSWPVYYYNDYGTAMLTYYLGQYMVPAAVGKLFSSFRVAEIMVQVYNAVGIFLMFLLLFRVTKASSTKKQMAAVAIFLAFGAVTFLSQCIYGLGREQETGPLYYYWLYEAPISFRSHINSLRYVFQICISTWIACLLFLDSYKNPRYYVLIVAPLLLGTVFGFITFAIIMTMLFCVTVAQNKEKWFVQLKRAFSAPNLAVLVGGLLIPGIYLMGNVLGDKPTAAGFGLIRYTNDTAIIYFSLVLGVLFYSLLIWSLYEKNLLFYLTNGILLVVPFLKFGPNNDLGMNCTIAPLFILMIFVIKAIFDHSGSGGIRRTTALVVLLFWSGVYLIYDIDDVLKVPIQIDGSNRVMYEQSLENMPRNPNYTMDYAYNYYTFDANKSVFVKLLAADTPLPYNSYKLGTELQFSAERRNAQYFMTGLTGCGDPTFAWSDSTVSSLAFTIGEIDKDVEVTIQYTQTYNGTQRAIVMCQDQKICEEKLDEDNLILRFTIPQKLIKDGVLSFTIEYPDAISPAALGVSKDTRLLAVGYQKMVLNTIE